MKQGLALTCSFTAVAAVWLAAMENILRHPGYGERTVVALYILLQSAATIWSLRGRPTHLLRTFVMAGAATIAVVGTAALVRLSRAQHFEWFVMVIGAALLLQAALTFGTLLPSHRMQAA